MKTFLTNSPAKAAGFIKKGGIVAFPTETVYGLGASVFDEAAIRKIFAAKRRPADNPLIAHVGNVDQIQTLAAEIPETTKKLVDAFFPGPLTLVLPKVDSVPAVATADLDTIGVRMPRNNLALSFLRECKTPLVAPSANLSGRPSPTTWRAVYEDLNGRIDCILKGETTEIGLESTVVDCTSEVPLILRSGAISLEKLREVAPDTVIYDDLEPQKPKSPGLRHKHYSPKAEVIVISKVSEVPHERPSIAFIGINKLTADLEHKKICTSVEDYARSIFEFFRECDRLGIAEIYCESVEKAGIGAALMDRIERASAKWSL